MKRQWIRKKSAAMLGFALVATPALAACGSDSEADGDIKTFTVGYIGAQSGPYGGGGKIAVNGLKAGVEYVNSLDGGVKFKLVHRDSKGDASAAANLARELAQAGVDAIFTGSTDIAAIQPVLNQHKILGADSGGVTAILDKLGTNNEFPWTFSPTTATGANTIVPQLRFLQEVGGTKVGMLSDSGPFGAGTSAMTEKIVAEQFPEIELISETFSSTASSATAQLQKLKDRGAETVLLWTFGAPMVMVMQNMDRIGWYPYVGAPLGAGEASVVAATPDKLRGKVAAGGIAAAQVDGSGAKPSPLAGEFYKRYSELSGITEFGGVDTVANYTFDWVLSLHAAIEGTDSTDTEKIRDWLTAGNEIVGSQGTLKFGDEKEARIGISLDATTVFDPSQPCKEGICAAVRIR